MKNRTLCLSPWRIKPGMILAKPATRQDGAVLLAAGTELTADQLEHLRQRGCEALCVGMPENRGAEEIRREVDQVEARVRHLFRGPGSAARMDLAAAVVAYRRQGAE